MKIYCFSYITPRFYKLLFGFKECCFLRLVVLPKWFNEDIFYCSHSRILDSGSRLVTGSLANTEVLKKRNFVVHSYTVSISYLGRFVKTRRQLKTGKTQGVKENTDSLNNVLIFATDTRHQPTSHLYVYIELICM